MLGVKRFMAKITSDALVRPDFVIWDREKEHWCLQGKFPWFFKWMFNDERKIVANLDITPYPDNANAGYYMFVKLWYGEMFFAYVPETVSRYQAHILSKTIFNPGFFIIDKERHMRYEEGKFPTEFKNMSVEDIEKVLTIIVDGGYGSDYGTYSFDRGWDGELFFFMELTEKGEREEWIECHRKHQTIGTYEPPLIYHRKKG